MCVEASRTTYCVEQCANNVWRRKTRGFSRRHERARVGRNAVLKGVKVVAAFKATDQSSVANISGYALQPLRHFDEAVLGQLKLSQRVVPVRVVAGGDDQKLGTEVRDGRKNNGLKFRQKVGFSREWGDGEVERRAFTRALTAFM